VPTSRLLHPTCRSPRSTPRPPARQNDSLPTLLARLEGILGPLPEWMLSRGRYAHRFYTRSGQLYERSAATQRYELLMPKRTSLRHR
jgi:dual specificity tyrosine-phosphorylation-regulated kinase 2/3/4